MFGNLYLLHSRKCDLNWFLEIIFWEEYLAKRIQVTIKYPDNNKFILLIFWLEKKLIQFWSASNLFIEGNNFSQFLK